MIFIRLTSKCLLDANAILFIKEEGREEIHMISPMFSEQHATVQGRADRHEVVREGAVTFLSGSCLSVFREDIQPELFRIKYMFIHNLVPPALSFLSSHPP